MSLSERLNKRIMLLVPATGQDAVGQPLVGTVDFAEVWAEVVDVSGDATVSADQLEHVTRSEMTIRALSSLPPVLLARYKGDVYDIKAVLGQNNRNLKLVAVKVKS